MEKYKISAEEFEKVSLKRIATNPGARSEHGESNMKGKRLQERMDKPLELFKEKLNALISLIEGDSAGDSLTKHIPTGVNENHTLADMIRDITSDGAEFASYLSVGGQSLLEKLKIIDELLIGGDISSLETVSKDIVLAINEIFGLVSKHNNAKENPHAVTKTQVGLDRVDNTSDEEKPLSLAAREAFATLGVQLDDKEAELIEKISEALAIAKEYADESKDENKAASNLLNGEGTDSIIQKYSGDVDDTHFGNSSTGESAAIFGEANKNSANRALMAGKLNENSGANGIVAGLYNIILKASNNIVGGRRNTLKEKGIECMVAGNNNVVDADCCVVAGSTNSITANDGTVLAGGGNVVEEGGNSLIGGIYNKAAVHNGVVAGQQNEVDSSDSITVGYGLRNLSAHFCGKAVIGQYNNEKNDTLFEVGNGNSDTDRSNAFEVIHRNGASSIRVGETEISELQLQRLLNLLT